MRFVEPSEPAFERVAVAASASPQPYDPAYRPRIVIDTLHDGDTLPASLLSNPGVRELQANGRLAHAFADVRDWGANLIAEHLAAALGCGAYYRVNVARVVMDFNRFPGDSPASAGPLDRFALSAPLSDVLDHEEKRALLKDCYDVVSAGMDAVIAPALLKLSIHTYDERNLSRTRRPEVSILSRSDSYQRHSRLPYGLFDPLFPDVLAESSAKPILRDRIALTLEKAGIYVEHNYPYCLPDGSVDIRSQPWFFFQHLRRCFTADHPELAETRPIAAVWEMLLNTNLRGGDGEALKGYLHRFRPAPDGREAEFVAARRAYDVLRRYVHDHPNLVDAYRRSPERTSAITLEVRKDLVWRFEGGQPAGPREDNARAIAEKMAEAIATYLREDREDG